MLTHLLASIAITQTAAPAPSGAYDLKRDIGYRISSNTLTVPDYHKLDLYVPKGFKGFPTVVWFHGGGLTGGSKAIPEGLKEKGFAVVAPNYRHSPIFKSPAYIEDAAAAVVWTMRNIGTYGGATNKIFVSGHSAGGYLASMVTLDKRWLKKFGKDPDTLAGLIPFSGQSITHFTIRKERGISEKQPVIDNLAPVFHVRKDAPPILLLSGDREKELYGRYEESAYFWRMLKEAGHPDAKLIELKGADHGGMAGPGMPHLVQFIRDRVKAIDAKASAKSTSANTP